MRNRIAFLILPFLLLFIVPSCTVTYSFTGANISADVKTFSVYYFPNRARLVNPNISQQFTEDLKEKLLRQTSLNELEDAGDLEFSGYISKYEVRPVSIQKGDLAAQNRLTISINVKYTNNKDSEKSFDQTFTAYEDFDNTDMISDVEDSLVPLITEKIIEDIYNKTIADW